MVSGSMKVVAYSKAMENLRETPTFCLKGHRKFDINEFHSGESWKIEEKLRTFSLKGHWDKKNKSLLTVRKVKKKWINFPLKIRRKYGKP